MSEFTKMDVSGVAIYSKKLCIMYFLKIAIHCSVCFTQIHNSQIQGYCKLPYLASLQLIYRLTATLSADEASLDVLQTHHAAQTTSWQI